MAELAVATPPVRGLRQGTAQWLRPELRVRVTTNGSQLARYAGELFRHGVRRINVSLDTIDPERFRAITRWGDLDKVLSGIAAARLAGLQVKINMVALKGVNEHEIEPILEWCHGLGMDLTLIETMPLGDIDGDRTDQYLPLSLVRARLQERYLLEEIAYKTGGPARYVRVKETGGGWLHQRHRPIISARAATGCG